MKLSVVIPVYNGADFIEKSYHSIINQDVEDFEILYVNNNSSDDSELRIKTFVAKDSRVKLIHQPKQGAAAARNMGIKQASGTYVYIFDVDDEIYPNALNKMMSVLDTHPEQDAVFGKMVKSYEGISKTYKPDDETNNVILEQKPFWGLHWFAHLKDVVGPPAFLYRRTIFDKIGVYNEGIKNTEDTAFDIKLGMTSNVAFLDTYVYLYFKHASSTIEMAKKNEDVTAMHWTRFLKSHLPFYLENDVPIKYKTLLYNYFYQTTGKRIQEAENFSDRKQLYHEIKKEIAPVRFPVGLRIGLQLLILFPFSFLRKLYVYYLVPYYINNHIQRL